MAKYAVIDCEDAEKWSGHEKIWTTVLGRPGDQWWVFLMQGTSMSMFCVVVGETMQKKTFAFTGTHIHALYLIAGRFSALGKANSRSSRPRRLRLGRTGKASS